MLRAVARITLIHETGREERGAGESLLAAGRGILRAVNCDEICGETSQLCLTPAMAKKRSKRLWPVALLLVQDRRPEEAIYIRQPSERSRQAGQDPQP